MPKPGRPPVPPQQAALVVLLMGTGLTDAEIARRAGVSPDSVERIRRGGIIRLDADGHAVALNPGEFMVARPMR